MYVYEYILRNELQTFFIVYLLIRNIFIKIYIKNILYFLSNMREIEIHSINKLLLSKFFCNSANSVFLMYFSFCRVK